MVTRFGGARIHEVSSLVIKASDLENIDHIMNILFVQSVRQYRTCQVGVALIVILSPAQDCVDVRIAAGAQQVMDPTAVLVLAVPRECILNNGGERSHIWQV